MARLGSFSAAARECGLSQPQASRIIADLEASLGARLLARTTRAVRVTDAGADFLARVDAVLDALDEAEASVREGGALVGVLRVGMPSIFGQRLLLPRLGPFMEAHPQLRVEIMLDDRLQDLVRDAVDVVIRVGARPDGAGTSRALGKMARVLVAAPAYLERAGTPKSPGDLPAHRIIDCPTTMSTMTWQLTRNDEAMSFAYVPDLRINDTAGVMAAVMGGLGIAAVTSWSCKRELADGTLVQVLPRWKMPPIPVHAIFPAGRATRKSARAFIDFVAGLIHVQHA